MERLAISVVDIGGIFGWDRVVIGVIDKRWQEVIHVCVRWIKWL